MLYNFIWGNKIDKISRKTLQLNYKKCRCGCKMTNVKIFKKSLKLTWIRRFFKTNSSLIGIFSEINRYHNNKLSHFGPEYCSKRAKATHKNFCEETLLYLCDFLENIEFTNIDILLKPQWYNNEVRFRINIILFMRKDFI